MKLCMSCLVYILLCADKSLYVVSKNYMNEITLHKQWVVKAPIDDVFRIMTDFERFPEHFPKVAESIQIKKREGNYIEMDATVRSFGKSFQVKMKTQILPGRGFISDNDSYQFGTSGHEEMLLSPHDKGTLIDIPIRSPSIKNGSV